ncbi:hypothetical protein M409DRAFT_60582 [Zasmidium cellare ATCC 36951]|uniref:Fungal N-terminal domain-containing protein n=1 Tax=Zasmidium cellare ATCC 36951 TaxID=1080233 RepID=A0A6A6C1F9_ZASCE|nr:uncharacterized protein M409DRAFT_60582 [Zasmidium cellare ATCC 36951]KAF2159649.1 hypothetical protein M409DRAFT_60582 [Zasmidium cellare ATCC 36951]
MHSLAVSAALFVAAGAFPALAPTGANSTALTKPDANSLTSILDLVSGGPTKRDNFLDVITRAIDDLENSILNLGSLVKWRTYRARSECHTTVQDTANLLNDRSEKRDNSLYVITREIDDIENTILFLGKLANNPSSKREADNSVTSTAQQATDNTQGTAQSSANPVDTKRDNVLDAITRAIDDLENSTLAFGSLVNSNSKARQDNTFSSVIQTAIDGIQSAIGALANLTTSD